MIHSPSATAIDMRSAKRNAGERQCRFSRSTPSSYLWRVRNGVMSLPGSTLAGSTGVREASCSWPISVTAPRIMSSVSASTVIAAGLMWWWRSCAISASTARRPSRYSTVA
ncbi:hypothetical protein D3C81_962130 [compost metagenome]